jgi:hypothetical protein
MIGEEMNLWFDEVRFVKAAGRDADFLAPRRAKVSVLPQRRQKPRSTSREEA